MPCPPGNCASWGAFRLCKPLPPICIDCAYTPEELQMLWFCWRARSTGEYSSLTPIDTSSGLIDLAGKTNMARIIEYCQSRGTLVAPFTNFSRFGIKFNLPNFKAAGVLANWSSFSGGAFGGEEPIAPEEGGTGGGGGGGTCPCTPDGGSDLTVAVCTELDCDAEEPKIEITVCGGTPPYEWTISGGEGVHTLTQSGTNNRNVKVEPPSETEVAGVAYRQGWLWTNDVACILANNVYSAPFGCQGESEGPCAQTTCTPSTFPILCEDQGVDCGLPDCDPIDPCAQFSPTGICDTRTQQMKDDGCLPCLIAMEGLTITVEDAVGATVVTVIAA